jgi:hypothetical protein
MHGELRVMDKTGDTKIVWDSANNDEVGAAQKMFDDLIKKGFAAFAVKKTGEPGKSVTEFDPEMEALIMVPRIVGG